MSRELIRAYIGECDDRQCTVCNGGRKNDEGVHGKDRLAAAMVVIPVVLMTLLCLVIAMLSNAGN